MPSYLCGQQAVKGSTAPTIMPMPVQCALCEIQRPLSAVPNQSHDLFIVRCGVTCNGEVTQCLGHPAGDGLWSGAVWRRFCGGGTSFVRIKETAQSLRHHCSPQQPRRQAKSMTHCCLCSAFSAVPWRVHHALKGGRLEAAEAVRGWGQSQLAAEERATHCTFSAFCTFSTLPITGCFYGLLSREGAAAPHCPGCTEGSSRGALHQRTWCDAVQVSVSDCWAGAIKKQIPGAAVVPAPAPQGVQRADCL